MEVYGNSAHAAYMRTIATREVTFPCVRCHQLQREWRYPGPTPKYCLSCCQQVAEEREELCVQRQREKRQTEAAQRRQHKA